MKILAEDLARLCYNAAQFSAKDSSLKGAVLFRGGTLPFLSAYASDDYVARVDQSPAEGGASEEFVLGLKEVKELEKWLRDKDDSVEITLHDDTVEVDHVLHSSLPLERVIDPPDFEPVIDVVWSEPNPMAEDYYPASREPFAIRAERFTKFRLLRTPPSPSCKDGYPVDFLWDGRLVRWRCGPFLRGVIAPLTRYGYTDPATGEEVTGIKRLYADEEGVLW